MNDYLRAQPKASQPVLAEVRAAIKKALPRATEGISYGIPVYKVDGRMVLYFAGFARHFGIYPATPALLAALGPRLSGALRHKATLRFSLEEPVPAPLIARIAKTRAAEAAERIAAKGKKPSRRPKKAAPAKSPRASKKSPRKPPRGRR